jgi:hypothetical protein
MAWPNSVTVRTVTGTYLTASGNPAKGRVTFTPSSRILDQYDAVILDAALTATLNTAGTFSISLPATDNPLLYPQQWTYTVKVKLYGQKESEFAVYIPYNDGSTINLTGQSYPSVSNTSVAPAAPSGPVGPRGYSVVAGNGPPTYAAGYDGDIYIDKDNGYFYGPKALGEWSGVPFYVPAEVDNTTQRYTHTQSVASSTWAITHTLGGRPAVTIVDSGESVVYGDIVYNSNSSISISFSAPFAGIAYLT